MPINNVENSVAERKSADFLRKSKRLTSCVRDELFKKEKRYLNKRKKSSISKGTDPISFEIKKIKNKLVYIILSLKRMDGVFLL
jgi:hypothetical protein